MMSVLLILPCFLRLCLGEIANNPTGRSRAKIVEDYLLSADFNSLLFPQVRPFISSSKSKNSESLPSRISREDFDEEFSEDPTNYRKNELMERDLVLHGHAPPPTVVSPYSIFAIGFISFLTLIATLQASLALLTSQKPGGLLGNLAKPTGRRRRSAHV